jgi:Protein of unknown function (DUF1592)/Protein of unknown function (DUF1588)/Protein of unknown function (DUF1595)/Protein of unknown function (DUF1587)
MKRLFGSLLVGAVGLASCVGSIGGDDVPGGANNGPADAELVATSGLRRMTVVEYFNTIKDLLKTNTLPVAELLPADARTPFDNDYLEQVASQGLIDAADFLAERAADELIADPTRRDAIVGCTPSGPDDEACLRSFVTSFGRRAMRRPLSEVEVDGYLHGNGELDSALDYATETGDFYTAVHSIVWAMLQDPEFLYRVEIGTPVEGQDEMFALDQFEVASRLSYFIWGSMPDKALLDRAEAGNLADGAARRDEALRMLADDRAKSRIARFHAMWLGYEIMPHSGELAAGMLDETSALIERVVFDENLPWAQLFTFQETFVNSFMADHYGLPAPSNPDGAWVSYAGTQRAGLFSHGTFLSIGAKFADTSPVQRGLVIRERLFCHDIADPPPEVDTDTPPEPTTDGGFCKIDRFDQLITSEGCVNCHNLINPLGYGLENYDQFGVFRTHEPDNPDTPEDESTCEIPGQGSFEGGDFSGPKELAELSLDTGLIQDCLSTQLYRFVSGRSDLDKTDQKIVAKIREQMASANGEFTFGDLVYEVVAHDSFAFRVMGEEE